jgi:hypothetical protein
MKLMGQLEPNFTGMIVKSFTKKASFRLDKINGAING